MTQHLILLSMPGLRPGDIRDASRTPTLAGWASSGASATLLPSFPCVTSTVQASTWTGVKPSEHGVIANGFYHRDRREVEFWVAWNEVVRGEQIWDVIAEKSDLTSAVWHAQNIRGSAADYIITPAPIHEPDGTTKLWCYEKPDGLYERMISDLDHFPLKHYWGPLANLESSKWILRGAEWLMERHDPNFHYIYIPHLDYASQKYGPDSVEASEALRDIDAELAKFKAYVEGSPAGEDAVFLVVSEYAMTDVSGAIQPNVMLREAGLLSVVETDDGERIDHANSKAFAMVDHQVAHIYADDKAVGEVVALFEGSPGVAKVLAGDDRKVLGIDHERSGEVVLASEPDRWFAYYWWLDDAAAPGFAHTVDIHQKPGYDPVELFFDPSTRSIPLDATLVKGSHGAPAMADNQRAALVCSAQTSYIQSGESYADTDVKGMVLGLLGVRS